MTDPHSTNHSKPARRRPGARYTKRHKEVVDAATRLFSERGYDGTSLLDIADAVGMLKGSLYYYAKSKEDLLAAIVEEVYDEGTAAAEEIRESTAPPIERLRRSIERAAGYMLSHREQAAIYFHDAKALSADRHKLIQPKRTNYTDALEALLRAGQQAGEIRSDIDVRVATVALIGAINWLAIQDPSDAPSMVDRERFVQRYTTYLLQSLTAPDH